MTRIYGGYREMLPGQAISAEALKTGPQVLQALVGKDHDGVTNWVKKKKTG